MPHTEEDLMRIKVIAAALALLSLAGCIVVPLHHHNHGGRSHDGHHRHHDRDRDYDRDYDSRR